MIAIVISVISLLVIIIVTVYLVNRNIDNESKRAADMRKLVDQVNSANSNIAQIDIGQNTTLSDLNTAIARVNKSIGTTNSNISAMQSNAVMKSDSSAELSTNRIRLNNSIITHDNGAVTVSTPDATSNLNRIIGFDSFGASKRMILGTELAILESGRSNMYFPFDQRGDTFIMTQSNDKRLMLQSGNDIGLVIKGKQVGVGMEPKYSQFDVRNNLAVVGDAILMGSKTPQKVMSIGKFGEIIINEGSNYAGAVVEGDLSVTNDLYVASGKIKANYDTPMVIGSDMNIEGRLRMGNGEVMGVDDNGALNINNSTPNKETVIVGGQNIYLGSTRFTQSNNPSGEQETHIFYKDNLKFASQDITPQSWDLTLSGGVVSASNLSAINLQAGNAITGVGIFPSTAALTQPENKSAWSIYNNNSGDLVMDPTIQTIPSITGNRSGVVHFSKSGDVFADGQGDFMGSVFTEGDVDSKRKVMGNSLCTKTSAGEVCLNESHLQWLISQYNKNPNL